MFDTSMLFNRKKETIWQRAIRKRAPFVIIKDIENRRTLSDVEYLSITQKLGQPLRVHCIRWTRHGSVHLLAVWVGNEIITFSPGKSGCTFEFI